MDSWGRLFNTSHYHRRLMNMLHNLLRGFGGFDDLRTFVDSQGPVLVRGALWIWIVRRDLLCGFRGPFCEWSMSCLLGYKAARIINSGTP